jgi:hypothetical protein
MVSVLQNVAIDCADAYELARFWSRVTGRPLHPEDAPGDRETQVLLAEGPVLYFNQVPESKKIKNRIQARFLREAYALSARTRSGRTRGRPGPMRGTRTFSSTGSNCGESPRCPAVTTIDMGF